ncbi:MAG: hypothetical protein AAF721_05510 [Myxococcota bacterium]
MLFKLIATLFLLGIVGRVLFPSRWKGMGEWFRRFIDLTLVLLAIAFGAQLIMVAMH